MIPMKHEKRIPMKLLKTYCAKGLMFLMSLLCVIIFVSILFQIISLSLYTFLLLVVGAGAFYFYTRSSP